MSGRYGPLKIPTITINTQTWMLYNLDVATYRNGDIIPEVTDQTQWSNLTTGAWCYYNNDSANGAIYGRLYNWYAVNDLRGLAPVGYHIPSSNEWLTLRNYLGGINTAGGPLKETGTTHWISNTGATNSSGFTALPGGIRVYPGTFSSLNYYGYWWTTTGGGISASSMKIEYNTITAVQVSNEIINGLSVRCLKD